MEQADTWVGHNVDLDYGVVGAEFVRAQRLQADTNSADRVGEFPTRPLICTMDASTRITPDREPVRLDELYRLLTGKKMKGMHDAAADMLVTAHCFFDLKKRGYFETV